MPRTGDELASLAATMKPADLVAQVDAVERFRRADLARDRHHVGAGLGLADGSMRHP